MAGEASGGGQQAHSGRLSARQGVMLLIAATVCFSTSDAMAKYLSSSLPVLEILWLRYIAFLALAVGLEMRAPGRRFRTQRPSMQVARALGIFGSAIFFILGLWRMPIAEITAISFVSSPIITLLSAPLLHEAVGTRRWVAVLLGLAGVLIVVRPGAAAFQAAAVLPLISATCWAIGSVITRKIAGVERSTTTLVWSAGVGLLILTAMLPLVAVVPAWWQLGLAFLLGTIAATAQYLVVLAYRHANASLLAPFSYMQLLWSTGLGWAVFGAWPDFWTIIGAMVIVSAGLLTIGRRRKA